MRILSLLLFFVMPLYGHALFAQAKSTSSPTVSRVYPSADSLPENLLRLYVYFSHPMQRKDALSSIRLLDDNGQEVDGAFLANRYDLWSSNNKRLTVLFDPGRVKTGLVAHESMGRAIQAGNSYELVIDKSLSTLAGAQLTETYRKKFSVTKVDFDPPDLSKWKLSKPNVGSKEALVVDVNGPHDHVSLAYRVRVKTRSGDVVRGSIELRNSERQWRFTPESPWPGGTYSLVVNSLLEDIAGNRMTGTFERPLTQRDDPKEFHVAFEVANRDSENDSREATTLFINGKILTVDENQTVASWMVIQGSFIKEIGEGPLPDDVEADQVIDLKGRTVIPGLIDSHLHFLRQGQYPGHDVRGAENADNIPALIQMLKSKTAELNRDDVVTVIGGIYPQQFKENRLPTRDELDQASASHVIYLQQNFSGPARTNSAGVALFRKNKVNVNDDGSIAVGADTNAAFAVLKRGQTRAERQRSTLELMKHANRLGLTMVFDEGGTPFPGAANFAANEEFLTIQSLWRDRGENQPFPLRVRLQFGGFEHEIEDSEVVDRLRFNWPGYGDDFLKNVAIGEHITPFPKDGKIDTSYTKAVELVAQSAWPHEQHSASFEENRQHLSAIEAAHERFPIDGRRWTLSHVFELGENEESLKHVELIKKLGMGVRVQSHGYMMPTDRFPLGRTLGGTNSGPLYRTLNNAGIKMGAGSDGPLGFPMNPWLGIYYITTGRDCTGRLVNRGQTLTRQEALKLYTINNAWLSFEEDRLGSLEVGKLADFVVLSDDYLTVSDENLKKLRARMTYVGGKRIYDDGTIDSSKTK